MTINCAERGLQRLWQIAKILSGAPLPPAIFIGSAKIVAPLAGRRSIDATFFEDRHIGGSQDLLDRKISRRTIIDARRADSDRLDASLFYQKFRELPRNSRKVKSVTFPSSSVPK